MHFLQQPCPGGAGWGPGAPALCCLRTACLSTCSPGAGACGTLAAGARRWVACTSMHIYLGSALVVIGQLVEAFIVPFFTLMDNVHRENTQTQKIINGRKGRR